MSRLRLALLCLPLLSAACGGGGDNTVNTPTAPSLGVPYSQTDLRVGTGTEATNGRRVTVNYTGWLYSTTAADNKGAQFDTSIGRGPFSYLLGGGGVIAGWERGIPGMRVGGSRKLIIPPELAYGSAGRPPEIPGNSTLIFEIDLLAVQ